MAAQKPKRIVVPLILVGILLVVVAILVGRMIMPSTVTVENASCMELRDVELRFTVDGKPVPHKLGALMADEKRSVTLDLGSGDFPFAASYRINGQKVNCDPGVKIKGRGEHVTFRISAEKFEITQN
ncbi:MAG: hypothetical protein NT049_03655 [Planctomycetota bacterium]|nr:hypothetical protein [Planctomycetota bacterium]